METTFLVQTSDNGQILTQTVFLFQMSRVKLSFSSDLKYFHENVQKTSHLGETIDYLKKKQRITEKVFFFQQV